MNDKIRIIATMCFLNGNSKARTTYLNVSVGGFNSIFNDQQGKSLLAKDLFKNVENYKILNVWFNDLTIYLTLGELE